ncbi:hypothetical protein LDENG_00049740 [Lucifuga dentata]|nr:hypothetical protein LDENG_00049740 [Lucifuga dentata]
MKPSGVEASKQPPLATTKVDLLLCSETGMYLNYSKDTNNNSNKSLLSDQKEKLVQAIKRIKLEVDECREAKRETHIESVEIESRFDELERETRAEFQNLHRFLDEEEFKDLERLRKERNKQTEAAEGQREENR